MTLWPNQRHLQLATVLGFLSLTMALLLCPHGPAKTALGEILGVKLECTFPRYTNPVRA